MTIKIDPQSAYHWEPEYMDLYQGLRKAKETRELTVEEKKTFEWLSFSFTSYVIGNTG